MSPEERERQRRSAVQYAREVADLKRRITALERSPSLARSSVHDGAITGYVGPDLAYAIGTQYDGTNGAVALTGPVPPRPSAPEVVPVAGGLVVRWDGRFADANGDTVDTIVAPLDFARVDIVVSPDPAADFIATPPTAAVGSARGGEMFVALGVTAVTVALVTRATTGKPSPPSVTRTATPLPEGAVSLAPPEVSPAVTVTGIADALVVRADRVMPGTAIEYHVSADPEFVPTLGGPTATGPPTEATITVIKALPNGDPFAADTAYYVRTIAVNDIDDAPPSAPVTGMIDPSALSDLVAANLAAEFILSGKIVVGQVTIDANLGITIPQPDGGTIHFPVDGLTDATITARLIARSLTVENGASLYRLTRLFGTLELTDGVVEPDYAPAVTHQYLTQGSAFSRPSPSARTPSFRGLARYYVGDDVNAYVSVGDDAGSTIVQVAYTDRGGFETLATPATRPWCSNFRPLSVASTPDGYFVLGLDANRGEALYVYALDSTMQLTGSVRITDYPGATFEGAIGVDNTNRLLVAVPLANGDIHVQVRASTGAMALSRTLVIPAEEHGYSGRPRVTGVMRGTFDFGAERLLIAHAAGNNVQQYTLAFNANPDETWRRDSLYEFPAASAVRGLGWNGTRFVQLDTLGRFMLFSRLRNSVYVRVAYSWYDGNVDYDPIAGQASAERETPLGPIQAYIVPARGWLTVSTDPAPGVDDEGIDSPNQIRVYTNSTGGSSTSGFVLLATLSVGVTRSMADLIPTSGTPPRADNTNALDAQGRRGFVGGASSGGALQSVGLRRDGRPKTFLDGSGNVQLDGLAPPGSGILWFTNTAPDGYLLALGQSLSIAQYPDLAWAWRVLDASGNHTGDYLYGGSTSSGVFLMPDLRRRALAGASGEAAPLGLTDGLPEQSRFFSHSHTVPAHAHTVSLTTGAPSGTRPVSGSGNDAAGANHTHAVTGSTSTNPATATAAATTPFVLVHVAIRY